MQQNYKCNKPNLQCTNFTIFSSLQFFRVKNSIRWLGLFWRVFLKFWLYSNNERHGKCTNFPNNSKRFAKRFKQIYNVKKTLTFSIKKRTFIKLSQDLPFYTNNFSLQYISCMYLTYYLFVYYQLLQMYFISRTWNEAFSWPLLWKNASRIFAFEYFNFNWYFAIT